MKKGIIVASFGTSYEKTRKLCIESVEEDIRKTFAPIKVERAFTSRIIRAKLKRRDNLDIMTEIEAVEKFKEEGVEDIYIQPLHIIAGHEYAKISSMDGVKLGLPLLSSEEDYKRAVEAVNSKDIEEDALILMGHGTDHEADESYKKLEEEYRRQGYENVYVATVEGEVTIEEILKRIEDIYIQPLHIIAGHEYGKISSMDGVKLGLPLLSSKEDYKRAVEAVNSKAIEADALILMGHGTDHEADESYKKLEEEYKRQGYDNVYVATVEGEVTIEEVLERIQDKDYKKILIQPFMLVAGDHAKNDMASDEDDSWKSILEARGYDVEVNLKGLGEYQAIREIYIDHLRDIMEEA